MTGVLARVPLARLLRSPRGWLPVVGWTIFAVIVASVARTRSAPTGADHMMRGAFGVLVLPLLSYAIVGSTLGGKGLGDAIRGLVTLGAPARRAALAAVLVAVAASAASCGLCAALADAVAHGSQDPPLVRDLPTALWVGALGGAAYAAYFSAASAIGKGAVRGVFLAVDWIIGSGAGVGAIFTPRGHVQSLLGGSHVAELSQRASSVSLAVLGALYVGLALVLTRRR